MQAVIILVCVILLIGNYVNLQIQRDAYNGILYVKSAQVLASFIEYVELEVERLGVISLTVLGDKGVQRNLTSLRDEIAGSERWREAKNDLESSVRVYSSNVEFCKNFGIYSDKGDTVGSISELFNSTKKELATMTSAREGAPGIVRYGDSLYFIRQIRQMESLKLDNLGTIIGTIDVDRLFRECTRVYEELGVGLNVTAYFDDMLIYQTSQPMQRLNSDGWQIVGDSFIVQSTDKQGWVYLIHMPYDEIYHAQKRIVVQTMLLTMLTVLMSMGLGHLLVNQMTRQLDKLLGKIDAYRKGVLPTEKDMKKYQKRKDEFGQLHRHFDKMAYENKQINDRNYELMLLQKEAQYNQLQQQIQPHFIYNTLSQITWIAYEHKDADIANLSNSLARMLRDSINFSEMTIRLADEMKMVQDYMLIQRFRFQEKLSFEIQIDPELENILIPKMTIQPVVENAVKYALEEGLDNCIIRVICRRDGEDAVLIVEDNGSGIDETIIEKLETKQIKAQGTGIGLLNIQKRIQMIFSPQYGLTFHRVDDRTQVWIRVPIQMKE